MRRLYQEYLLNILLSTPFKEVLFNNVSVKKNCVIEDKKHYTLINKNNNDTYEGVINIINNQYFFIFDKLVKGLRWNNGIHYILKDQDNVIALINGFDELFTNVLEREDYKKSLYRFKRFPLDYAPKSIFPLSGYYDEFVDRYYPYEEFLEILKEKPAYINKYRSYVRYMDIPSLYKEEDNLIAYLFSHKEEYQNKKEEYKGDSELERIVHQIKEDNKPQLSIFDFLDMPVVTYFHLEHPDERIVRIIEQVNGRSRKKRKHYNYCWGGPYNEAEKYIKEHPELLKVIPYKKG